VEQNIERDWWFFVQKCWLQFWSYHVGPLPPDPDNTLRTLYEYVQYLQTRPVPTGIVSCKAIGGTCGGGAFVFRDQLSISEYQRAFQRVGVIREITACPECLNVLAWGDDRENFLSAYELNDPW
jgi:hypothetical protein